MVVERGDLVAVAVGEAVGDELEGWIVSAVGGVCGMVAVASGFEILTVTADLVGVSVLEGVGEGLEEIEDLGRRLVGEFG